MSTTRDIINIDVPLRTRDLVARAYAENGPVEAYFGHGLTLRATPTFVQIVAENPDDETLDALEKSGNNFRVIR